ncbi:hypothetical protein BO70DRAFT_328645, partial [Aspergillus heteromorphus CBS 117.55]
CSVFPRRKERLNARWSLVKAWPSRSRSLSVPLLFGPLLALLLGLPSFPSPSLPFPSPSVPLPFFPRYRSSALVDFSSLRG